GKAQRQEARLQPEHRGQHHGVHRRWLPQGRQPGPGAADGGGRPGGPETGHHKKAVALERAALQASELRQMTALLRYHYGLEVDRMPEAKRLRLWAELQWIEARKAEQLQSD